MKRLLAALAAPFAFAAATALAQADYPSRTVTLVVPFPPGGVADITARPVAEAMGRHLKQAVVVENKAGAGGGVGMQFVARAKPDALSYASSGPGTPYHMAGELFKAMAGLDIVHIPYKGSSGARTDVLGGQVHMMFDAIPTMAPNVRGGKLKGLATSGKVRSAVLPEVPTLDEAGVPGYEATIWLGLMAPTGTPRPVLERLNAEVARIAASAEVREAWQKQGAAPLSMGLEAFDKYLREDISKWARVVKLSGAKVD